MLHAGTELLQYHHALAQDAGRQQNLDEIALRARFDIFPDPHFKSRALGMLTMTQTLCPSKNGLQYHYRELQQLGVLLAYGALEHFLRRREYQH